MKTKARKKDKVNIVTLGCSKNLVDSEVLLTQLRGNDIEATHESEADDSTIVIVNTCGFIGDAKQESIDTILRYADAKENGQIEKLYVTGCLSQRYKDELEEEIPAVDAYFGTMELPGLLKRFNADYKHELLGERMNVSAPHYAHLKISEGCDRPCSFCAIPLMRGKHISRPIEDLVREAGHLAKNGVKELLLIAQDSTYYGLDIYGERKLADLLRQLSEVNGIEWIRLHYAFPSGFPMDVLEVMAEKDSICSYLDIPLQHGSNAILKAMRRGITREKTEDLLGQMRAKVPGIAIRTTLIVGYPGETQEDFEEMMKFVEESRFDRLGVFTYSHEEDTHAYNFEDDVPEEVKQERANAVMELQEQISLEINQKKVGKVLKVLIDRVESGYFVGRTEYDSPEVDNEVLIDAKKHFLRVGDFAQIKITEATEFDLTGVPVEN
ncbi:MAG: 30S ribosomal protein S12 methylthiotransferase RimO [Cyclobacteriaceae bacterium]|nr:30S ribosomal protein S12 methylthiotransferase RimO [Cyclobacteriaceae bacterium]